MDSDDLGFLDLDQIFSDQLLPNDFLADYEGSSSPGSGSGSGLSDDGIFGCSDGTSPNHSDSTTSPLYGTQSTVFQPSQPVYHSTNSPNNTELGSTSDSLFTDRSSLGNQFVQNTIIFEDKEHLPRPQARRSAPPYSVQPIRQEDIPLRKARTPVREQKIHATDLVQIIKVEPDCETLEPQSTRLPMVTQNKVILKVEPPEILHVEHRSISPPSTQANRPDILTQACHSIGMDSKGQFYRRSEAQKKAEERKIKNRHSASVSRERKKRHLEDTECKNTVLVRENEQLKKINKELMDKIRILQSQAAQPRVQGPPRKKRLLASTACLSIVFGLVFMTLPYAPKGPKGPTGMENVHNSRKLFMTDEVANTSEFWLDDLVNELRDNHAFNELMYRAHFGQAEIKKVVQRKLYEEFKIIISTRRMSAGRYRGKLELDSRTALRSPKQKSSSKTQKNQNGPICPPSQNKNAIHQTFSSWRTSQHDFVNLGENNSTETGLVRIAPSRSWTHAELMESLSQSLKNDSYYVLSNMHLPIWAPARMDNTAYPKMTFFFPAENSTLVDSEIEMHEIVCSVMHTKTLRLYRGAIIGATVEQEDDDTRIEIEV